MKDGKCHIVNILIGCTLIVCLFQVQTPGADPWKTLQEELKETEPNGTASKTESRIDPWTRLQAIFLPFSEKTESAALVEPEAARKVSGYLHKQLKPYARFIGNASRRFNIPPEIIGAVIMVESGGNPKATAKTSSARGLMQTVKGTFHMAKKELLASGVRISDTPYDPYASIMAGSWYLDRMFERVEADGKSNIYKRHDLNSWKYPLEYYYAGPENGKKKENTVIMYAGGRRVVIDKPAYSKKVLRWAQIMKNS